MTKITIYYLSFGFKKKHKLLKVRLNGGNHMLYEFYFCSTILGNNPEAWEQRTVIEAEDRDQAKMKFIEKLGIPYMSDPRLDYVDCTKIS